MRKPIRIVGGELQREPDWSDEEYAQRLERHRADQRLGAAHLLSLASVAVVERMMSIPDDAEIGVNDLRSFIVIAKSIEATADLLIYVTDIAAAQALMDLKSARQRAEGLLR